MGNLVRKRLLITAMREHLYSAGVRCAARGTVNYKHFFYRGKEEGKPAGLVIAHAVVEAPEPQAVVVAQPVPALRRPRAQAGWGPKPKYIRPHTL
jgi:hypothetical protein